MQELSELAQSAMALLTPVLPLVKFAGGKMAEGFLKEPGAKFFNWLAGKLRGTRAEPALNDALAEPHDEDTLEILRIEIQKMARADAAFRGELEQQVRAAGKTVTQTATATGGSTVVQVAGKGHRVNTR